MTIREWYDEWRRAEESAEEAIRRLEQQGSQRFDDDGGPVAKDPD